MHMSIFRQDKHCWNIFRQAKDVQAVKNMLDPSLLESGVLRLRFEALFSVHKKKKKQKQKTFALEYSLTKVSALKYSEVH